MRPTLAIRGAAYAIAVAAVFDPACSQREAVPVPVRLQLVERAGRPSRAAEDVRARLTTALEGVAVLDAVEAPRAVVVVGDRPPTGVALGEGPVSAVSLHEEIANNVRIVSVSDPRPVMLGWTAEVTAVLEGIGLASHDSVVSLEYEGVELSRMTHTWTRDREQIDIALPFVPPSPGTRLLRVVVQPTEGETASHDNHADVRVVAEAGTLEVLAYEPRPSWSVAFIRRALEADPLFEVSALTVASRGIAVRAGEAPNRLAGTDLERFDAILVGAPEQLNAADLRALDGFMRRRGGAVLFLPDRRPSGEYRRMLPAGAFDELLVDRGLELTSEQGPQLRASEVVLPIDPALGTQTLVRLEQDGTRKPVVITWPVGVGRAMFSGALDAWRYRGQGDGFSAFWRAQIAGVAASSPKRLEALVEPGVVAPGERVTVRAALRPSEIAERRHSAQVPEVRASLVAPDGGVRPMRLWPAMEVGVFRGEVEAPGPGTYAVHIESSTGASADAVLSVREAVVRPSDDDEAGLRTLTAATGGVFTRANDLDPIERYIQQLARAEVARRVNPMRSSWWMGVFAGLLCAEWTVRRRRGAK